VRNWRLGRAVVDTTAALDHAAPDCASRQTCKTVLAGQSRGVFQGKILVRREAQETDGYQMNEASAYCRRKKRRWTASRSLKSMPMM
jgi:hypothetical protein